MDIGVITIGQSPRVDLIEDIMPILDEKFNIIEEGALDNFDLEYVRENLGPEPGHNILVSRMRDGEQVTLSEEKIIPLIQKCINDLEQKGCRIIVLLCTGKFPEFQHREILIYPQKLMHRLTEVLVEDGYLGILVPDEKQIPRAKEMWDSKGIKTKVVAASPYLSIDELKENCKSLSDTSIIYMDCMGYSKKMKDMVASITGKLVILSRNVVFAIVNQLV